MVTLQDWGLRPYDDALHALHDLLHARLDNRCGDTLVLVEHPAVITIGRQGSEANILVPHEFLDHYGVKVVHVERGGDITYHGPGQLVAYPVFHMPEGSRNVKAFIRHLERAIIETCAHFSVPGETVAGLTGVWTNGRKIASIGLAFKRWTSYHGIALNVDADLEPFSFMHLCGLEGKQATSLAVERGERAAPLTAAEVKPVLARNIITAWNEFLNGN
jgi:lipoyl(octanoyl) transferase